MLPTDKLLDHPSPREFFEFNRAREAGGVSIFKTRKCDNCGVQIPDEFRCCSEVCHNKLPKEDSMGIIKWDINLQPLFQGKHRIETNEGAIVTGRITKIEWSEVKINGRQHQLPTVIILDDDTTNSVDWSVVKSITRV